MCVDKVYDTIRVRYFVKHLDLFDTTTGGAMYCRIFRWTSNVQACNACKACMRGIQK